MCSVTVTKIYKLLKTPVKTRTETKHALSATATIEKRKKKKQRQTHLHSTAENLNTCLTSSLLSSEQIRQLLPERFVGFGKADHTRSAIDRSVKRGVAKIRRGWRGKRESARAKAVLSDDMKATVFDHVFPVCIQLLSESQSCGGTYSMNHYSLLSHIWVTKTSPTPLTVRDHTHC